MYRGILAAQAIDHFIIHLSRHSLYIVHFSLTFVRVSKCKRRAVDERRVNLQQFGCTSGLDATDSAPLDGVIHTHTHTVARANIVCCCRHRTLLEDLNHWEKVNKHFFYFFFLSSTFTLRPNYICLLRFLGKSRLHCVRWVNKLQCAMEECAAMFENMNISLVPMSRHRLRPSLSRSLPISLFLSLPILFVLMTITNGVDVCVCLSLSLFSFPENEIA